MTFPKPRLPARFFSLGFAALAALLAMVAMGMHIHRMSGIPFNNYDDLLMGLTADRMRAQGWKAYFDLAGEYAVWQGRAYFYFSMIFFVLPYFIRSLLWRAVISALLQFGATCSVGAVVGLYAGFRNAALFVALTCACLPYWYDWYPVNGYPFVYHLPVLLFFAGQALYISRIRGYLQPAWRQIAQAASWIAFFVSLFFYEALIPVFVLIAVTVSAVEARRAQGAPQEKWDWSVVIKAWTPWFSGFALWAAIYLGFRRLHPATYEGSGMTGLGRHELADAASSVYYFEKSSLPGANWIGNLQRTAARWQGTPQSLGYARFFVKNLTADGIVLAVLTLAVVLFWFLSFRRESPSGPARVGKVAAMALACAVLSPLPLELTAKYRSLETVLAVAPYLPGYYSFLAWCVVLALLFPLAGFALQRFPAGRLAAAALLACGCAGIAAANAMSNDAISREYAELTDKWKLVDLLARSRWFAALPPHSVFVVPPFSWDTFASTWPHTDEYWSAYFSGWAHRPVRVVRSLAGIHDLHKTPVFYCEYQWLPGRLDAVLAVDPILSISPADGYARSDSLLLVSRFNPAHMVVEYRSSASAEETSGAPSGVPSGPRRARIPEGRYEHGGYLSQASIPDLIAGTARLADPETAPPPGPPVNLQFQRGFSASTEHSQEGHYWRWSDGQDGAGELDLVNLSPHPLTVRFRASLQFKPEERRTVFDFILPHSSETISAAPGDTIERIWQLSPGDNRILVKCHAGRLPAPGDPRYIVFGIWDWSVVPVGN
jgi:hypothetical protein